MARSPGAVQVPVGSEAHGRRMAGVRGWIEARGGGTLAQADSVTGVDSDPTVITG
jgi:hypothetical protein